MVSTNLSMKLIINFFKFYDYSEFNDANIKFKIDFNKKSTVLELQIVCEGVVNINCTLSNEPFDYNLESQFKLNSEVW